MIATVLQSIDNKKAYIQIRDKYFEARNKQLNEDDDYSEGVVTEIWIVLDVLGIPLSKVI